MTDGYRAGGFDSSEGGIEGTARGLAISYLEAHGLFVERGERWACDCEGAPIVVGDGRQAVLVSVLARAEEGSEAWSSEGATSWQCAVRASSTSSTTRTWSPSAMTRYR